MLALAMDDEHASLAAGARVTKEREQLRARLLGGRAVQIEPRVDRKQAAAQGADDARRYVRAASLDAPSVVRYLEARAFVDQLMEMLEHLLGLELRLRA